MAKVSRSTWSSTLATNIQDNTAADILPSEVRTVFGDLEDSVVWYEDNLTGAFTTDVKAIGTVSSGTTTLTFTGSNFQRRHRTGDRFPMPSARGPTRGRLWNTTATVAATVPDAFVAGDWVLEGTAIPTTRPPAAVTAR
jgi:hypothetical protein